MSRPSFVNDEAVAPVLQDCLQFKGQNESEGFTPDCLSQGNDLHPVQRSETPRRAKGLSLVLMVRSSCACGVCQLGGYNSAEIRASGSHDCKTVKKTSDLGFCHLRLERFTQIQHMCKTLDLTCLFTKSVLRSRPWSAGFSPES